MAAAQKPISSQTFGQIYETPAWKDLPSWYLLATEDQAINPELQRMFAERMRATIREVTSKKLRKRFVSARQQCRRKNKQVPFIKFAFLHIAHRPQAGAFFVSASRLPTEVY
jgi:hypothetical protein